MILDFLTIQNTITIILLMTWFWFVYSVYSAYNFKTVCTPYKKGIKGYIETKERLLK